MIWGEPEKPISAAHPNFSQVLRGFSGGLWSWSRVTRPTPFLLHPSRVDLYTLCFLCYKLGCVNHWWWPVSAGYLCIGNLEDAQSITGGAVTLARADT